MCKCVYFRVVRRSEFGIIFGCLSVIMRSKVVYGVGILFSIYDVEYGWVNRLIVFVDELVEDVCFFVKVLWYLLRIDNYFVSCVNLKNI